MVIWILGLLFLTHWRLLLKDETDDPAIYSNVSTIKPSGPTSKQGDMGDPSVQTLLRMIPKICSSHTISPIQSSIAYLLEDRPKCRLCVGFHIPRVIFPRPSRRQGLSIPSSSDFRNRTVARVLSKC
ncbi:hypothetical protein Bca101_002535 [Brassica carinata]